MTTAEPSPDQLRLDAADRLLRGQDRELTGIWPRVSAWLIRLAIEHAANTYCSRHTEIPVALRWRAKWLALAAYLPEDARRAGALWCALSRVAHHHAYELPPTVEELRSWLVEATSVCEAMNRHAPLGGPVTSRLSSTRRQ